MTDSLRGTILGFIGVAIFSLTLPLSRLAVTEVDPVFLSLGRTVVAGAVALLILVATRQPMPTLAQMKTLAIVVAGVVFGFPVLSAIAMRYAPAAHGGVVLGALPLATAVMSTWLAGERPSRAFWLWSVLGSAIVIGFALRSGSGGMEAADLLLLGALLAAAMGYAAGGQLSRVLGGWQVICWALVLALPLTTPLALWRMPTNPMGISGVAWGCFLYLALMSQLVGFFAWNRGLALGGVARVGQVQLLQTFMTIGAAAIINGEALELSTLLVACAVALCVWFARQARVSINPVRA